jgi:curved DNA-binding protein CbpA
MNYYEEFGLQPQATAAEIRQAYRSLARLLHPDTQPDDQLRAVAQRQMVRLNEVAETLLDPGRRAAYDRSLRGTGVQLQKWAPDSIFEHRPPWLQLAVQHWHWTLMGLVTLGLAGWFVAAPRSGVPLETTAAAIAPPAADAPSSPASQRSLRAEPVAASEPPVEESAPPSSQEVALAAPAATRPTRHAAPSPPPPLPPAASTQTPFAVSALPAVESLAPAPAAIPAPNPTYKGMWLYSPKLEGQEVEGTYRPAFIELRLDESDGLLSGVYRARYQVPDQAIPPEVLFNIRGATPASGPIHLGWTAADGAKGEIEIALRSPALMRVRWWTTAFGRLPGLASGEALLVKELTR